MAQRPVVGEMTYLDTWPGRTIPLIRPAGYHHGMKTIMLRTLTIALLVPGSLLAAERLPDSAPPDEQAPQTSEKGPTKALESHELEALYLQSPVELDTTDESQGLNALSNDSRYLENEQQELLQRQRDTVQIVPTPEAATPPPPPTLMPVRDL